MNACAYTNRMRWCATCTHTMGHTHIYIHSIALVVVLIYFFCSSRGCCFPHLFIRLRTFRLLLLQLMSIKNQSKMDMSNWRKKIRFLKAHPKSFKFPLFWHKLDSRLGWFLSRNWEREQGHRRQKLDHNDIMSCDTSWTLCVMRSKISLKYCNDH